MYDPGIKRDSLEPTELPSVKDPAPNEWQEDQVQQQAEEQDEVTGAFEIRNAAGDLLPPGMLQRLVGAAVDFMVIETAVLFTVGAALHGYNRDWTPPPPDAPWTPVQFAIVAGYLFLKLLFSYGYYGWWYTRRGTSPGKWSVGLQIVDAESGGRIPTFHRAFLRETAGKLLSVLPFMGGYLVAAFRKDRRALHDILFKTRVVYRPPR
jgi:uncharacterized RDD family membrane protein YckC